MSAVRMKSAGIIIALAMLGAFAMLLFPPWQLDLHSRTGAEIGTEFRYAPLWMPPQQSIAFRALAALLEGQQNG